MTYDEAVSYLHMASARGWKFGLARVRELTKQLGMPQDRMRVIHIAGTNGKGSVGAMLASILTSAGIRTGHFASPALTSPCDFFRLNTQEVSREQFASVIGKVSETAETMEDLPTEYEVLAAAAYTLFAQERCEIAVIECSLGGDTDCTNVISAPLLSIITNVQLDHQKVLGTTVGEIAQHKAGILKPQCPALLNDTATAQEGVEVIRAAAEQLGTPLHLLSEMPPLAADSVRMDREGLSFCAMGLPMHLPLLGRYQLENVQTVLAAAELLRKQGIALDPAAVRQGLSRVKWHGRFEVLHRDPPVIFDGAHNPDGIRQAHQSLTQYLGKGKAVFLIGVMADKDHSSYARLLRPHIDTVFTVTPDNPRALPARELARYFREQGIAAHACESITEGVSLAFSLAKERGIPLIALGSLYLYRAFCDAFSKNL